MKILVFAMSVSVLISGDSAKAEERTHYQCEIRSANAEGRPVVTALELLPNKEMSAVVEANGLRVGLSKYSGISFHVTVKRGFLTVASAQTRDGEPLSLSLIEHKLSVACLAR